jgi:hypothetical protein
LFDLIAVLRDPLQQSRAYFWIGLELIPNLSDNTFHTTRLYQRRSVGGKISRKLLSVVAQQIDEIIIHRQGVNLKGNHWKGWDASSSGFKSPVLADLHRHLGDGKGC